MNSTLVAQTLVSLKGADAVLIASVSAGGSKYGEGVYWLGPALAASGTLRLPFVTPQRMASIWPLPDTSALHVISTGRMKPWKDPPRLAVTVALISSALVPP
jgi:hypothetical protein